MDDTARTSNTSLHLPGFDGDGPTTAWEVAPRRFVFWIVASCVAFEVLLVLLDLGIHQARWIDIGPIRRLTDITRDDALGFWFTVTQLQLVSVTLWLLYFLARNRPAPGRRSSGWLVMALFFSCLTLYEGGRLHKRFDRISADVHSGEIDAGGLVSWLATPLEFVPVFVWQFLLVLCLLVLAGYFLFFLRGRLENRRPIVWVAVAVGLFLLALAFFGLERWAPDAPGSELYEMAGVFFKMLAMTTFWFVLLGQFARLARDLRMLIREARPGRVAP